MIMGGAAEIVAAFSVKSWSRFAFWLLLGLLYIGGGIICLMDPFKAATILTLFLGVALQGKIAQLDSQRIGPPIAPVALLPHPALKEIIDFVQIALDHFKLGPVIQAQQFEQIVPGNGQRARHLVDR